MGPESSERHLRAATSHPHFGGQLRPPALLHPYRHRFASSGGADCDDAAAAAGAAAGAVATAAAETVATAATAVRP